MYNTNFIKNDEMIPDTHVFVYKNKKFPIKYDYFKYASNYFSKNQYEIKNIKEINLLDSEIEGYLNFTDSIIQDFINFVQNKEISLNDKNAYELNYLSNKYEVRKLKDITNKYISRQPLLAVDILFGYKYTYNKNCDKIHLNKYEEMISLHMEEYVNDDRIIQLDIPMLYRIFKQYFESKENFNPDLRKSVIELIFKILKQRGEESSILFECIEFGEDLNEYLDQLIKNYSEIFDFQFLKEPIFEMYLDTYKEKVRLKKENEMIRKETAQLISEIKQLKKHEMKLEYEKFIKNIRVKKIIKEQKRKEFRMKQLAKNKLDKINKFLLEEDLAIDELIKEKDIKKKNKQRRIRKKQWILKQKRKKQSLCNVKVPVEKEQELVIEKEQELVIQDDKKLNRKSKFKKERVKKFLKRKPRHRKVRKHGKYRKNKKPRKENDMKRKFVVLREKKVENQYFQPIKNENGIKNNHYMYNNDKKLTHENVFMNIYKTAILCFITMLLLAFVLRNIKILTKDLPMEMNSGTNFNESENNKTRILLYGEKSLCFKSRFLNFQYFDVNFNIPKEHIWQVKKRKYFNDHFKIPKAKSWYVTKPKFA